MIVHAISRLIMVPLGFMLGAGVAIMVLLSLGLERITQAVSGQGLATVGIELLFGLVHGFIGLAGVATVVPALAVVIVGEVARIRSMLYYVLGGGLAIGLLPVLARVGVGGASGSGMANLGQLWPVFATAGFAGGLVYWLVAGRRA